MSYCSFLFDEMLCCFTLIKICDESNLIQAHPPIYPTQSIDPNQLDSPGKKNIYELVSRHFLACCSEDAKGQQTNVRVDICGEEFNASGLMITER